MIMIDGINIRIIDILSLNKSNKSILIKRSDDQYFKIPGIIIDLATSVSITISIKNDFLFKTIMGRVIGLARANKNPEKRVLDFEWFPDYKSRDRLIEQRKTNQEKQVEITYLVKTIEQCENRKIDCSAFKESLNIKLAGSFGGIS